MVEEKRGNLPPQPFPKPSSALPKPSGKAKAKAKNAKAKGKGKQKMSTSSSSTDATEAQNEQDGGVGDKAITLYEDSAKVRDVMKSRKFNSLWRAKALPEEVMERIEEIEQERVQGWHCRTCLIEEQLPIIQNKT